MNEGYAIFTNNDGSETKLSWEELSLKENEEKYRYNLKKDRAFKKTKIKEISIPEGITYIHTGAFDECKQLEKVILPSSLMQCGTAVFHKCDNLKEIIAPKGLYIEVPETAEIKRTNVEFIDYQYYLNKFNKLGIEPTERERENIQQVVEEIDHPLKEVRYYDVLNKNDMYEVLKLKNSNGERYFDALDLIDFCKKNILIGDVTVSEPPDYIEWEEKIAVINCKEIYKNAVMNIEISEKLGIKPELSNNVDELKNKYIQLIENKLQTYQKEFLETKNKENDRNNMQVQSRERG